jgi:iron-sulfur cluster assembly accessory protein
MSSSIFSCSSCFNKCIQQYYNNTTNHMVHTFAFRTLITKAYKQFNSSRIILSQSNLNFSSNSICNNNLSSLCSHRRLINTQSSTNSTISQSPHINNSNISIHLTSPCEQRINQLRAKYGPETRLRLSVDSGGCSGFSYQFSIEKRPKSQLKLKADNSTTNNNNDNEDLYDIIEGENGLLVVDSISLPILNGSTIDYHISLERAAFTVLTNPNANQSCGCGSSFTPAALDGR